MLAIYGVALGLGLMLAIAVLGGALGQAYIGNGAMHGMARQPELQGRIQTSMIIALAFVESLILFTLLIAFLLLGKLPGPKEVIEAEKAMAVHSAPIPGQEPPSGN